MATYTVTHTCGHVVKHRLYGKRDYRQWQLGRLAGENCWECRKAVQSAAAAEVAAEVGLPTLQSVKVWSEEDIKNHRSPWERDAYQLVLKILKTIRGRR